jgi:transcriptional regulator with XRE-family HTH domain
MGSVRDMSENTKKSRKCTQYMTGKELKQLRKEMKFDPRDMCCILEIPRRSYQDYEAGKRGIPAEFAERVRELHHQDRAFIAGIAERVDTDLVKYPGGIVPQHVLRDIWKTAKRGSQLGQQTKQSKH